MVMLVALTMFGKSLPPFGAAAAQSQYGHLIVLAAAFICAGVVFAPELGHEFAMLLTTLRNSCS
jgi:hypothetical protein